jgi:hypothetical protein
MGEADRVWRLVRGDELVAELVVTGGDFPWLNARTDGQFLSFCFTSRAKMRGSDGAMNPFQKWKRALTVTSSSAALRAYHRTVARGIGLLTVLACWIPRAAIEPERPGLYRADPEQSGGHVQGLLAVTHQGARTCR